MALFRIGIKPVKRSAGGQPATGAATYLAGERTRDERTRSVEEIRQRAVQSWLRMRSKGAESSAEIGAGSERDQQRSGEQQYAGGKTSVSNAPNGFAASPLRVGFHPALRSVLFCSCYMYSPRGGRSVSAASRLLCARVKSGDAIWLPTYAGLVRDQATRHEVLAGLFGKDVVLVPVPGSSPSATRVWAAERLAVALHGIGLGKSVWPGVERRFAVRKSATALNTERPTVQQHYESFFVPDLSGAPRRIVLIDDVITKGRTILAAAARLHEALPCADIRAFALVRTMGLLPDVSYFLEPCLGVVRWAGGDARREP
jgi:hypothetical protein